MLHACRVLSYYTLSSLQIALFTKQRSRAAAVPAYVTTSKGEVLQPAVSQIRGSYLPDDEDN